MAIVDGLIVCVQLHGGAGRGRGRAGREADSLTPGSEFSHPLKERLDCVRVLSDKHLIPTQTHTRTHAHVHTRSHAFAGQMYALESTERDWMCFYILEIPLRS